MTHIEQRLAERNIKVDYSKLLVIAKSCGNTSAAILLGNVPYSDPGTDYHSRQESNGDLVVMIVRDGEPKTIMFRRSNQPFTPSALNVNKVYSI